MDSHQAETLIATCIDFRLQKYIDDWIAQKFQPKTFDRVALGGGVKNLDVILGQVKVGNDLHHINKVILINHEDCGAYGKEGTYERHIQDLKNAREKVNEQFPILEVETYYLHLDGNFESIA